MFLLGLMLAVAAGLLVGWHVRPHLEARVRNALPFLPASVAETVIGGNSLPARLDAAITEIEQQMRQGIDRERNATRLQILREVKDGD